MLVTYERFRNVLLPAYDPSEPVGSWPVRSMYADLVHDGAYRLNGSARSAKLKRTVRRTGMLLIPVVTSDQAALVELQEALGLLEAEQGNTGKLYGRTPAGDLVWTTAELIDVQAVREPRSLFRFHHYVALDVETEFILPTPGWFAEQPVTLRFTDIYDADDSDFLLMGVGGPAPGTPVAMTWNILGRANTGRIVITLTSGAGTVSKFAMSNTTTGYSLQWDGTLTTGQELEIDTDAASIYRNSVAAYDELTLGAHTRWMELAPGINEVTVEIDDTATDDSTVLQVAYYPAYP